jgi:tetratricopeptide (TPR) repeat protein
MNEKLKMATIRSFISLFVCSYLFLFCTNCEEGKQELIDNKKPLQLEKKPSPDLSKAIEKRIEGKPNEAIEILRLAQKEFPNSPEVIIQLARSLFEAKQYQLAAFRFDQAQSSLGSTKLYKEAGLAHEYSEDFETAIQRYSKYLSMHNDDSDIWLRLARLLALADQSTESLNAFSKGSEACNYHDCITMAKLYYRKKLIPQAEHWFREAARRQEGVQAEPLLGLLRIKLLNQDEENAESLILAIEKNHPGSIEGTDLDKESAALLRKRNFSKFVRGGASSSEYSITELSAFLLNPKSGEGEVVGLSKIPPDMPSSLSVDPVPPTNDQTNMQGDSSVNGNDLASAFAAPVKKTPTVGNPLNLATQAYLDRKYNDSIRFARTVLKEDPTNPEAWRICSQSHFQLGETKEAEMTILEALRHDSSSLSIRMDYLRVARETLDSKRYLDELENAREKFPNATELVWELARRYHLVERMPVTAGILYRQVVSLTAEDDSLHDRAKMELLKLREP